MKRPGCGTCQKVRSVLPKRLREPLERLEQKMKPDRTVAHKRPPVPVREDVQ